MMPSKSRSHTLPSSFARNEQAVMDLKEAQNVSQKYVQRDVQHLGSRHIVSARALFTFLWIVVGLGLATFRYLPDRYLESSFLNITFPLLETQHRLLSAAEAEKVFLSLPNSESAHATAKALGTMPHLAGSSQDFQTALWMLEHFQKNFNITTLSEQPIFEAGSEQSQKATLLLTSEEAPARPSAWIDIYHAFLDTPLDRTLDILDEEGNSIWSADLVEDGDSRDSDAHRHRDSIHTWHGYSAPGEATGQLLYANYATQEDFQELIEAGADLKGKIILARYGGIYRGLKVKGAQELGAIGVLLFDDPRDDGYITVENGYAPYPEGPARNPTSVQRGSTMFLSMYPGDPTTPGYPSYKDAERKAATNIPSIPSLPISLQNAERLLEEIDEVYLEFSDDGAKRRLSGRSSNSKVKIVNHVNQTVSPIWNTMATIPGRIRDEIVIIGGHRDAWVMGAADPISGQVSLHEVIRSFGVLLNRGWKPLRTVLFASWDAEEQGLIGSVEYCEDFGPWISKHAVAYINIDGSSAGSQWEVLGSPLLAHLIKDAALEIPHPYTEGKTLWDARWDEGAFPAPDFAPVNGSMMIDIEAIAQYEAKKQKLKESGIGIGLLGGGSDFTPFLQHLGIPSMDQGFGGTPYDAPYHYHSIYDTVIWQERYADPEFNRHVTVAKHMGLVALRLIDSEILPLNTTQYSLELDDYLESVKMAAVDKNISVDLSPLQTAIRELQKASLDLDREKEDVLPRLTGLPGYVPDFSRSSKCQPRSPMMNAITNWIKGAFGVSPQDEDTSSQAYDATRRARQINKKLSSFERGFISKDGIKDREWYKHLGVASGKWLGYGATTFPALTEAIVVDKNATAAEEEIKRLSSMLVKLTKHISSA